MRGLTGGPVILSLCCAGGVLAGAGVRVVEVVLGGLEERTPSSWLRLEVLLSMFMLLAITGGGDWLCLCSVPRLLVRAEYGSWTVLSLQTRLSSTSCTSGWHSRDISPAAAWLWAVSRIIRAA